MISAHPEGSPPSLAEKLKLLFDVVRDADGNEYSQADVARFVAARTGLKFDRGYVSAMLKGTRDNPTRKVLVALAEFFSVNPVYFFDDDSSGIHEKLQFALALRESGARSVAMRALLDVDSRDLPMVTELLRSMNRRSEQHFDEAEPE